MQLAKPRRSLSDLLRAKGEIMIRLIPDDSLLDQIWDHWESNELTVNALLSIIPSVSDKKTLSEIWHLISVKALQHTKEYAVNSLKSNSDKSWIHDNNPHVLYWNQSINAVKYAVYDGESWTMQIIETNPISGLISYNTLVLDEADVPHAAYEISGDYSGAVHYAWWNGMYWEIENVISLQFAYPGSPQGIALDSSGMPHVTVHSVDMGYAFIYAWRDSTGWNYEIIQYDGVDDAICLDSEGNPHISYCDFTNEDLKYAHRPGTGIESESQSEPRTPAISVCQNPCTGYALIQVNLPDLSSFTVKVYDTSGRLIDLHTRTNLERGTHTIQLGEYPPGIYYCGLNSEFSEASTSFVVLESR
mgnify:CR=1 FL=1